MQDTVGFMLADTQDVAFTTDGLRWLDDLTTM